MLQNVALLNTTYNNSNNTLFSVCSLKGEGKLWLDEFCFIGSVDQSLFYSMLSLHSTILKLVSNLKRVFIQSDISWQTYSFESLYSIHIFVVVPPQTCRGNHVADM